MYSSSYVSIIVLNHTEAKECFVCVH